MGDFNIVEYLYIKFPGRKYKFEDISENIRAHINKDYQNINGSESEEIQGH